MSSSDKAPYISIVVPFFNEDGTLRELRDRVAAAMEKINKSFELLLIDDGSTDGSLATARKLAKEDPRVKVFSFRHNSGKAAALQLGFEKSIGARVFTMDADLQDAPEELPELLEKMDNEGWDLISGWKAKRHDPITKKWPSKLYNWATSKVAGVRLHDFNCGLKLYRSEVVKEVYIYGEMHRYIPVLAHLRGFKVTEKVVQHYPRKWGESKYGAFTRMLKGFLDLLTVVFLQRYMRRPAHLFGGVGFVLGALGFVIAMYLTAVKIMGGAIGNRPLLQLAVLLILVGVQLLSIGLVGEMITANHRDDRLPLRRLDDE